jgi:beta-lactamase regulating signal transducer with metallopeptidase domain
MNSVFLTSISPYIPYILISTFVKCTALLIIAALIQLCLKKLSSNMKHLLWLALLFSVVLMPLCSFVIPQDFFTFQIQSGSSSGAMHILDVVLPRYTELGAPIQSASDIVSAAALMQSSGPMLRWEVFCVMFWLTGIVCSLARVLVGKFGIVKILNDARVFESSGVIRTLEIVSKELSVRRNVQVLASSSCRVPFTYGTFKPVILLPAGATAWPEERLRSVLIHELAHVKRIDSLTQLFARIVCSFFWFIPMVWIAYRHLQTEQEKSCDEYAVGEGIKAARYARHLLNVVRFARGRVILTGIFISRGKRKMLEKRILHLLKPDAWKCISRKKVFLTTAALCFFLLFPILVFNPMFAEDVKKKISKKDFWNAVSGTWVNTEYLGTYAWFEQKWIVYSDGKWECYTLTTDTNPSRKGYYLTITEAWTDSEGVIWGKSTEEIGATRYQLHKISDSGNTWEISDCPDAHPTEMDKFDTRSMYYIRYRQ